MGATSRKANSHDLNGTALLSNSDVPVGGAAGDAIANNVDAANLLRIAGCALALLVSRSGSEAHVQIRSSKR
jgi:hypothetical protein